MSNARGKQNRPLAHTSALRQMVVSGVHMCSDGHSVSSVHARIHASDVPSSAPLHLNGTPTHLCPPLLCSRSTAAIRHVHQHPSRPCHLCGRSRFQTHLSSPGRRTVQRRAVGRFQLVQGCPIILYVKNDDSVVTKRYKNSVHQRMPVVLRANVPSACRRNTFT
jgi:hypothetical protein